MTLTSTPQVMVHQEISRLLGLYNMLLDDQLYEPWVQLFTEDGVLCVGGTEYHGHTEITTFVAAIQPVPPGKHFAGLPVIDVLEDGLAHAWSDMVMFLADGDGVIRTPGMCRFHDVLVRVDGEWRFACRYLQMIGEPLAAGAPPRPLA